MGTADILWYRYGCGSTTESRTYTYDIICTFMSVHRIDEIYLLLFIHLFCGSTIEQ